MRFKALTPFFDTFVAVGVRERTLKARLLDQVELPPGASVLDVGAGTGTLAIQMKERWPDARVTGLDADPQILAIARRKASEAGAEIDFVEGFSNELPFEDASFDAVVSTLFFHHLNRDAKRATLSELARVLKPGGGLHIGDYGKGADPLQRAAFGAVRGFDGFAVTADNARGRFPAMVEDAGFEPVEVRGRLRTPLGTMDLIHAKR
jgi:ubiquinone/menaquinone biosynthesis C-methylase UbiE